MEKVTKMLPDIQEWLQGTGLRATKTRRLLFEVLQGAKSPQAVPELQKALAGKKYRPHKTTLYREIEQLEKRGLITKVQLSEERVSYELGGEHHHHFVCENCNRVTRIAFCEALLKTLGPALENQGKYLTRHQFEFFGICEFCA